ncbi:TPP-dependent acetoin dehydrogenase complex, E1 protein subunit beta [Actinomadura sp. NBRC 104412]|uniref:alpha-ketoacid dehydrogenase subunit beta n=1 Tax=Actinomadura sp. NBRC 104412 TaxID=3032203 RepID=UPI0024A115BB|nr:pyruvate dehydrogenase complex E1 component subunit beta [Actinomadura sp. NBRC 104412]GLZ06137.1 TPP-dependent acetoin dehydrogenase complex, E1 protein subunit beta [Actinomadura sp. NBRC 104412]
MSEQINYRQTIARALADALAADPDVILIGEDVAAAGGAFKSTVGLLDRFGPERVRDTPISEQAIVGAAIGAAMCGLRPVAEIMFADFAGVCFDQIANQLAKYRYMTGGQVRLPVTIRMAGGAGSGFAAQHSQAAENWFLNIPGLKIAVPGTVPDLYGLTRAAIQDDNPVLIFEHKNLFAVKGTIPPDAEPIPLGRADVVRHGGDVTIVATQQMRWRALEAAGRLATEGIEATVIDPRTLVPFDDDTVVESLTTTSRLTVVQEAPAGGSWGASLIARMTQHHFFLFDAPPLLLCADDTPVPYAANLEEAWMPSVEEIVSEVRKQVQS